MRSLRGWLDSTPLADLALGLMREATGRPDPLEPLRPERPHCLAAGRRLGLWSLVGGGLILAGVWMIFRKAKPAELEECETALPQG